MAHFTSADMRLHCLEIPSHASFRWLSCSHRRRPSSGRAVAIRRSSVCTRGPCAALRKSLSAAHSASNTDNVDGWVLKASAALAALAIAADPAQADTAELFTRNCAGCHAGGGNVVQAGASLSTSDMRKNGVLEPQALYDLIYGGRGKMPGYGKDCTPKGKCTFAKRLEDDEIRQLAAYTLQQAEAGWK